MRELVDDVQHPVLLPLRGAVFDKVITPDMVGPFGTQTDAGPIGQPEPPVLWLLCRGLQALEPPDPLDPLVIDDPAGGRTQKLRDLPPYGDCKQSPAGQWIAIPTVLANQYRHIVDERLLVIRPLGTSALRRAMLSENTADPPLGQL